MERGISVYVHVPFCAGKCKYCDFNSFDDCSYLIDSYFDALVDEISCIKERIDTNGRPLVDTIFFGGGTPTFPHYSYIMKVMEELRKQFVFSPNCEITIESNPGTVSRESLKAYYDAGFNRLSIGLQSANDMLLNTLGRIHKFEHFETEFIAAKEVGFNNINVDIMFGLPGQETADLIDTVDKVLKYEPTHISCYSLIVEEGTPFYEMYGKGDLILPNDEEDREMYHSAIERLNVAGLKQYEISNFALTGYECQHNVKCWQYYDYIGFGAGACSLLCNADANVKDSVWYRTTNAFNVKEYINARQKIIDNETIDFKTACNEYFMLGLRMIDGVDLSEFKCRFDVDAREMFANQFENLINRGIVKMVNNRIKLTDRGLDVANLAFMEFV